MFVGIRFAGFIVGYFGRCVHFAAVFLVWYGLKVEMYGEFPVFGLNFDGSEISKGYDWVVC